MICRYHDRMIRVIILTLALLLAGAACTSEQIYNAIRENRIQACENIPIPQQESCRAQYETSYEEYDRDLEELRAEQQR